MDSLSLKIYNFRSLSNSEFSVSENGNKLRSILIRPSSGGNPEDSFEILPEHTPGIFSIPAGYALELRYSEEGESAFKYNEAETREINLEEKGMMFVSNDGNNTLVQINKFLNEINLES